MYTPVRLGIVGLGSVFEPYSHLLRQLEVSSAATVTMVCDLVPERADRAERFLGHRPRFTTDYEQVVSSDEVDVVVVLTSMPHHGEIGIAALESGKHALVEKPMATSLDEAQKMLELSQADGAPLLVVAPHVVLSPTYQALWKRITNLGQIGRVLTARGRYGWAGPDWAKWYYEPSGGALYDLGVYNVTSLTGLLGSVQRVTAMAGTAVPERLVEGERIKVASLDNMQTLLDFGDGVFAALTTGFTMQQYHTPCLELYGEKGTLQMLGDDWAPEGYQMWTPDPGSWQTYPERDPMWHWTEGLRHLVDCVRHGRRPVIRPEHAYHVLEVMYRAQEAGLDGHAREIQSRIGPLELDPAEIDHRAGQFSHDRRIIRSET